MQTNWTNLKFEIWKLNWKFWQNWNCLKGCYRLTWLYTSRSESADEDRITDRPLSLFLLNILLCSYPTALEMIASGAVNVKPLVTHHFDLEETLNAFQTANDPKSGAIKVMIKCNVEWHYGLVVLTRISCPFNWFLLGLLLKMLDESSTLLERSISDASCESFAAAIDC